MTIQADIYGLGCVLHHALAGQPPFADVSPVRQLLRHATETAKPIAEHNPEVPGGVQQILTWMLAKDPARRYPTPARAAQALEMFVVANSGPGRPTDTRMNVFLEWVDTLDGSAPPAPREPAKESIPEISVELVSPADIPAIRPKPPSVGPRPPPPPQQRKAPRPTPVESEEIEEEEDKPARVRKKSSREEEKPVRKRGKSEDEEQEQEPERLMGMRPRELMLLTIGLLTIFAVGVIGLLGWLVYRMLS